MRRGVRHIRQYLSWTGHISRLTGIVRNPRSVRHRPAITHPPRWVGRGGSIRSAPNRTDALEPENILSIAPGSPSERSSIILEKTGDRSRGGAALTASAGTERGRSIHLEATARAAPMVIAARACCGSPKYDGSSVAGGRFGHSSTGRYSSRRHGSATPHDSESHHVSACRRGGRDHLLGPGAKRRQLVLRGAPPGLQAVAGPPGELSSTVVVWARCHPPGFNAGVLSVPSAAPTSIGSGTNPCPSSEEGARPLKYRAVWPRSRHRRS